MRLHDETIIVRRVLRMVHCVSHLRLGVAAHISRGVFVKVRRLVRRADDVDWRVCTPNVNGAATE